MDEGTALDVGTLKVADLKVELAKRNLSTAGLKKDLASRLQEAIEKEQSTKTSNNNEGEQGGGDQSIPNVVGEEAEQPAEVEVEAKSDEVVELEEDVATSDTIEEQHTELKEHLAEGPSLANRIAEEAVVDDAPPSQVEDAVVTNDDVEMMTTEQPQVNGTSSLEDRLSGKANGNDEEEVDVGREMEAEVDIQSEEPSFMSSVRDAQRKGVEAVQVIGEDNSETSKKDEKLSSHHQGGLSPYSNPPAPLPEEQSSSTKPLSELTEETRQLEQPSRSVYITGLVRPLTLPSFRAKAEEFGELGGNQVKEGHEIWLDGVKTHAYVTYQDEQSALSAKSALSGSVYPPETGKKIQVYFIPQDLVERCIAIEELAWEEERGKMEIKVRVGEDSQSLLYSLHRLDAVKKLETTLPVPARSTHRSAVPSQRGGPFNKDSFPRPPKSSGLQWGSSSHYDRNREFAPPDNRRDDFRHNATYHDHRGRDRYNDNERRSGSTGGSSRADERVREVEARIRADRERGNRGFVDREITSRPAERDLYNSSQPKHQSDSRWSNTEPSRKVYYDRHREYSPPPNHRREYSDRFRDERSRRD